MTFNQSAAKREVDTGRPATGDLLERFMHGDEDAARLLVERSIPELQRWVRGRSPGWARSLAASPDLVQDAVVRSLPHLHRFGSGHAGAVRAYLRQSIVNHVRDEVRKVRHGATSSLRHAIGPERVERYEAALARLRPIDRQAIVARLELRQSYDEVARALGKPSPDAARMMVARAVRNLLRAMDAD